MNPLVDSYNELEDKKNQREAFDRTDKKMIEFWMKLTLGFCLFWAVTWFQ